MEINTHHREEIPCVSLSGKLTVTGYNGSFRHGILQTEMGEFLIQGDYLDEVACGVYEGFFYIAEFVPCALRKNRPSMQAILLDFRLGQRAIETEQHPWFPIWDAKEDNSTLMADFVMGVGRFAIGFMEGARHSPACQYHRI